MQLDQYALPTHWACALMYGGLRGLDDDDLEAIRRFTEDMVAAHGQCLCLAVGDGDGFVKHHDAALYGVLACDCSTYTFDVTPNLRR